MKMPLKYVKSQKCRDQLLHEGYLHKKERASGDKIFWKCADYQKYHCTGRAHTCNGKVIKYSPHSHPPNKTAVEAKGNGMTEMASSSQEPTHKVATLDCDALPGPAAFKKPRIQNNPKQTIQLLRARLNATRQGIPGLQVASAVAETVAEDPPSLTSPDLPDGFVDGSFVAAPGLCKETKASMTQSSQEAARQRFRLGTVPPGDAPQEILSRLSEAAERWLCPREHSKDQIVDMVILEQFLTVLPVNVQVWVRAREPVSSKEAVQLIEACCREQEQANGVQGLVTFEDVSVHFTEEEWALLDRREKTLYWNVTNQNYDNVAWLGDVTNSKRKREDPWLEAPELVVMEKSKEAILQSPEQDVMRENCQERQQKISSGKEEEKLALIRKGLRELVRDTGHPGTELGLETWCICADCENQAESLALIITLDSPSVEGPEPVDVSGKLHALSEKKNPQNLEQNLIKEDQNNMERLQTNHSGKEEEKSTLFTNSLRDPIHQDPKSGLKPECICAEAAEEKSLTLDRNQKIQSREDSECVVLCEESLEMSEGGISQSPEQDLQPKPMQVCTKWSLAELNETADLQHNPKHVCSEVNTAVFNGAYSQVSECRTAASVGENQNILESHQNSSSGNEGQGKCLLLGNGLRDLSKGMLQLDAQPGLEGHCREHDQASERIGNQEIGHRQGLYKSLKSDGQFTQNSDPVTQSGCSDPGEKPNGLLAFIKRRRCYKRGKYFNGKSMSVETVLGAHQRILVGGKSHRCLTWKDKGRYIRSRCRLLGPGKGLRESLKHNPQTHEALHLTPEMFRMTSGAAFSSLNPKGQKPEPRSPTLDKMAAELTLAQLMAVLEQVAADTAEIKFAVSSLHTSITGIQNALGSLSGCTDEAEHRISDLEDTSRNTKAQLVQQCNDIKAIEAKLTGKAVQTKVIAGLWSLLKVKREATHTPCICPLTQDE
ncbi:zinc finger protein 394-like isoform X2 [Rhineura floridana]|uniref:zinc finger protein 394-like isoform X2 n=1 Tax=Rhineura floridana TaxID=261503 RepID=UPI002AC87B67|nr:zinc finger protein 394-like isoform X2 [Rhineura floridana]